MAGILRGFGQGLSDREERRRKELEQKKAAAYKILDLAASAPNLRPEDLPILLGKAAEIEGLREKDVGGFMEQLQSLLTQGQPGPELRQTAPPGKSALPTEEETRPRTVFGRVPTEDIGESPLPSLAHLGPRPLFMGPEEIVKREAGRVSGVETAKRQAELPLIRERLAGQAALEKARLKNRLETISAQQLAIGMRDFNARVERLKKEGMPHEEAELTVVGQLNEELDRKGRLEEARIEYTKVRAEYIVKNFEQRKKEYEDRSRRGWAALEIMESRLGTAGFGMTKQDLVNMRIHMTRLDRKKKEISEDIDKARGRGATDEELADMFETYRRDALNEVDSAEKLLGDKIIVYRDDWPSIKPNPEYAPAPTGRLGSVPTKTGPTSGMEFPASQIGAAAQEAYPNLPLGDAIAKFRKFLHDKKVPINENR